jgi:hypothetical protein
MVIKYTNISIPRPSKITQSGVFGTKTQKPSGNPGAECGNSREKLFLAQIRNFVDCQCDQIGQNFDFLGKKRERKREKIMTYFIIRIRQAFNIFGKM